jgi:hypothetical protein
VSEGIQIKEEQEEDITTDSSVDSEDCFDYDSEESDFDNVVDGDEDIGDENM